MQNIITRESVDEIDTVREIASRLGVQSMEAEVLAEYERRQAAGDQPVCLSFEKTWVITPFRRYLQGVVATLEDTARALALPVVAPELQ